MKGADKQLQKVADKLNEAIHQQGIDKLQKEMGHSSPSVLEVKQLDVADMPILEG